MYDFLLEGIEPGTLSGPPPPPPRRRDNPLLTGLWGASTTALGIALGGLPGGAIASFLGYQLLKRI